MCTWVRDVQLKFSWIRKREKKKVEKKKDGNERRRYRRSVSCLARHGHESVQYHFAKHETGENDLTMFFMGIGRLSEEERHVWFWYTRYNVTHTDSRAPCGRNGDTKKAQWPTAAPLLVASILPGHEDFVHTWSFRDRHARTIRLLRVPETVKIRRCFFSVSRTQPGTVRTVRSYEPAATRTRPPRTVPSAG